MFKNYLVVAWRNFVRTKGYSAINVGGLCAGMIVAIIIGLWVADEIGFNRSFKNHDRIGQIYHHITLGEESMTINDVPAALVEALKSNYPEFEQVALASWPNEHMFSYKDENFSRNGFYVDPEFLGMFSMEILQGPSEPLTELHSAIVSSTLAETLFGNDAIGKVIKFENRDLLTITGVFRDFPANSEFNEVQILLPMEYYYSINDYNRSLPGNWENYAFQCFVLMKDELGFDKAGERIKNLLFENSSEDGKALKPKALIFPMAKWHLFNTFEYGVNTGGQIRYVWMFGIMGVSILLLACINFTNLSTARSESRSREIGVRKVIGSGRSQLIFQFLSESLLVVAFAYLLAVLIAMLCLPWFNTLADKKMSIPWGNPFFIGGSLVAILVTGCVAGIYPALFLSSFKPVSVLKGSLKTSRFSGVPRKILVVFQFAIAIVLQVGTVAVFLQIQHARNRPVGFDKDRAFHVELRTEALKNVNYNTLRNELLSTGVVEEMAVSDFPITGGASLDASLTWEGADASIRPMVAINSSSHDFPKTSGFQFLEGRDFSRTFATDSMAVIVNEKAAKLISASGALGKKISLGHDKELTIIGVIKDQVRSEPFAEQLPHIYYINYKNARYLTVKVNKGVRTDDAVSAVGKIIHKFDPAAPFDYTFLDDDYDEGFKAEIRVAKLASVAAVLSVLISCVGMLGLAAFAASRRIKEIGIRKVMGATVLNVWLMLSRDFVVLVGLAVLVGLPFGSYFADQWLAQYDYRVQLPWELFALTGVTAIVITLITVSYQALRAAMVNPVRSLRNE